MKLIEIRHQLHKLGLPVLSLNDVMGVLNIGKTHAAHIMSRLVNAGEMLKLKRGIWTWPNTDPVATIAYLSAPYPSYISMQSALFHHGAIDQIPNCYYVATLRRRLKLNTPLANYSFHQINSNLFFGYETHYGPFFNMATLEKALIDYLYLSRSEPLLFGTLPEVDISLFNKAKIKQYLKKIENDKIEAFLRSKLHLLNFPGFT